MYLVIETSLCATGKKGNVLAVAHCNKARSGNCLFGEKHCWFQHGEINKSHENENNENENNEKTNGELYNDEIIRKIFDMMESFAHRIVDIEKKTNDNN